MASRDGGPVADSVRAEPLTTRPDRRRMALGRMALGRADRPGGAC